LLERDGFELSVPGARRALVKSSDSPQKGGEGGAD